MTISRAFHNGTFLKVSCLQKSIVKLKAEGKYESTMHTRFIHDAYTKDDDKSMMMNL